MKDGEIRFVSIAFIRKESWEAIQKQAKASK